MISDEIVSWSSDKAGLVLLPCPQVIKRLIETQHPKAPSVELRILTIIKVVLGLWSLQHGMQAEIQSSQVKSEVRYCKISKILD